MTHRPSTGASCTQIPGEGGVPITGTVNGVFYMILEHVALPCIFETIFTVPAASKEQEDYRQYEKEYIENISSDYIDYFNHYINYFIYKKTIVFIFKLNWNQERLFFPEMYHVIKTPVFWISIPATSTIF